eukprot:364282-Chlamydomonas_euryale.AAC.5
MHSPVNKEVSSKPDATSCSDCHVPHMYYRPRLCGCRRPVCKVLSEGKQNLARSIALHHHHGIVKALPSQSLWTAARTSTQSPAVADGHRSVQ